MIGLRFRRGLASIIKRAEHSGFATVALAGTDVAARIEEERDPRTLTQAFGHACFHNELSWAAICARRLAQCDPRGVGPLPQVFLLASAGKLDEAEKLMAATPEAGQKGELFHRTAAALRARQGRIDEAFGSLDRLSGRQPLAIALMIADELLQGAPLAIALDFIRSLRRRHPANLLVRSILARGLALDGSTEEAEELAAASAHELAQVSEHARRHMRETRATILSMRGWNNELFDYAREVVAEDPTHWAMYYQASEAAVLSARLADYDEIMGRLLAARGTMPGAEATLSRWLVDRGRIDEARTCIKGLRSASASGYLGAELYLAVRHGNAEDVRGRFGDCVKYGTALLGPVLAYCIYLYYYNDRHTGPREALDLLEQHRAQAQNNATYWQLYLRCLIATDRAGDARASYAALPRGLRASAKLRPFDMYFDVLDGEDRRARDKWAGFIANARHVCVNGRTSYPDTVSLRYVEKPGAVLVFATVFNGMAYLDWFLDHYRALGVDHFFFTDNASDDGTAERLRAEPDVSLFSNAGSFASSAFGIVWINHHLQRFGLGHWCFHVDIDEGFVFPGCDRGRSLHDFLGYLDAQGYGTVAATEVDMYADGLETSPAENQFSAHRHFDSNYRSMPCELPPYRLIRGGVRQRMTGLPLTMTKMPLVRVSPEFRYIECNHHTTHLPLADVTTVLLHYKFVGNVVHRLREAIDRGEHFGGALAYRRLRSAADQRGWGETLLSGASRTYYGASSLEAEGLMESSAAWESFSRPA